MLKKAKKLYSDTLNLFKESWGAFYLWYKLKVKRLRTLAKQKQKSLLELIKKQYFRVRIYLYKRSSPYLSSRVEAEKRRLSKSSRFEDWFKWNLYEPSLRSFIIIAVVFALLFSLAVFFQDILNYLVSLLPYNYQFNVYIFPEISTESNHYQNLLAVLGVVGGIVFALAIFIAESFRDSSTDRGRVLLRESLIWPLTVSVILTSLLFMWGDKNYMIFLPLSGVALFSLWALKRVVVILLNRVDFLEKRRKFLKGLLQRSIDSSIRSRLADVILLTSLDNEEMKLDYRPFSLDANTDFVTFKSSKLGRITDIDLVKLERFGSVLDRYAQDNGYSFGEQKEEPSEVVISEEILNQTEKSNLTPNNKRYLIRKYEDQIDEEHNTLICFDRLLIGSNLRAEKELRNIFKGIFQIEEGSLLQEEAEIELRNLKNEFITAIKADRSGDVEEYAKTYFYLAEGYLEQMFKHGGVFDYHQAKKERSSFFSGWDGVQWLSRDIYELLSLAVEQGNKDILSDIAYLPIGISRRAIEKHDHYSFQEFIRLVEMLYVLSSRTEKADIKTYLKDRSWRYLKELSSLYIQHRVEEGGRNSEEIKSYEGFVVHSIQIFQNLIKMSFENRDYDYFTQALSEVNKLLEYGHFERYSYEVDRLEYILEQEDIAKEEKDKAREKLDLVKSISDFWNEIENRRKQMIFGMATFIFDRYQREGKREELQVFFNKINGLLPNDLSALTNVFLQCHNFEAEDFWKWDSWDLVVDGGVQSIQVLEKLEKYYVVKALQILGQLPENGSVNIQLPTNRDLVYLADGSRDLISTLDNIEQNPANWSFVLNETASSKVSELRELLKDARDRQIEANIEEKIEKKISRKKINKFIEEAIKSFGDTNYTIPFFKYLNSISDNSKNCAEVKNDKKRLGINQVDEKAVFLEDWHEGYGGWGESYGESMARGLDREVFTTLLDKAEQKGFSELDDLVSDLGGPDSVVLVSTGHIRRKYFSDEDAKFIPSWDHNAPKCDIRGFSGWYKYKDKLVPVFEVFHSVDNQLLVMSRGNSNVAYEQQCPLYGDELSENVRGWFYFDIRAFSEDTELLDEMLEQPPEWLVKEGGTDEQKRHLLQRALIKVFMRYKLHTKEDLKLYKVGLDS